MRSLLLLVVLAPIGCSDALVAPTGTARSPAALAVAPEATHLVVDFGPDSALFPPWVNKIGFNSFWNSADNNHDLDAWTIARSAKYRVPLISGLVEPKSLVRLPAGDNGTPAYTDAYEEYVGKLTPRELDAQACSLWEQGGDYSGTLFHDDGNGGVEARKPTDADLALLRETVRENGMLNFLQIAGTPGTALPYADGFDNGLFTLTGTPPTGANWYPLPDRSAFPRLAHAFGTLPGALGYDTHTIYAFWQEPAHTIDEDLSWSDSVDLYTDFYAQVAVEIEANCRRLSCPMAGAQMNSLNGRGASADGGRYARFMDGLRAQRENSDAEIPLDWFTLQDYSSHLDAEIFPNARVALGTDANWTPILVNEWDYCVNDAEEDAFCDGVGAFGERFDGPSSWKALHRLKFTVEQPDVSHVLLRETVLRDRAGDETVHPWTQVPILFMAAMSELRRPVDGDTDNVPVIASGDDDQLTMLMWNEGEDPKTRRITLQGISPSLVGDALHVKRFSDAIRDANCPGRDVMNAEHEPDCWDDVFTTELTIDQTELATPELVVAPGEVVLIFAGTPPVYGSSVFDENYLRSYAYVARDGSGDAPDGMAQFDPRTGSLTAGVRAGGIGLGRVVLADAPATLTFTTRFAAQGEPGRATVAGVRVDWLDRDQNPVKSVFFRDDRWTGGTIDWTDVEWAAAPGPVEVVDTPMDGTTPVVSLDIDRYAPAGWTVHRDIDVGVVLAGAGTDATYRVDLP